MSIHNTTEFAATSPEVIRAIVLDLRKSDRRYTVFEAVYGGGSKPKDAKALAEKTGLGEVAVLQLATPMANKQFFEQVKQGGRVKFKKYPHINAVKQTILRAAKSVQPRIIPRPSQSDGRRSISVKRPRPVVRSAWNPNKRKNSKPTYDVFVCHASEDKGFVTPLVNAIKKAGIKVWYDEDTIQWGDGLRRSIDKGLLNSRYGIVVFSKAFLKKKHWAEHELDGLFARERGGRKVILPIWHNITDKQLMNYSSSFSDRVAMISKRDSIQDIVRSLKDILHNS